jgi:hypothetical protein
MPALKYLASKAQFSLYNAKSRLRDLQEQNSKYLQTVSYGLVLHTIQASSSELELKGDA